MSDYKKYLLRQLGIKESSIQPSIVERNSYPGIDPQELEIGTKDEKDDHGMPIDKAKLTAKQHLAAPDQEHYYSGVEKAKKAGMLKDTFMGGGISPTAIATPVIGIAVRGSSTGGFPSGMDQTGISPNTPTGRLGGYEPIPTAKDNSELVGKTPANAQINSASPISNVEPTSAEPHAHQVQQCMGEPPQNITGASTDSDSTLTLKSGMPKQQATVDIDINQEGEMNDMDGQESMEDEDDAKAGLNETFARHMKLMRQKIGLLEGDEAEAMANQDQMLDADTRCMDCGKELESGNETGTCRVCTAKNRPDRLSGQLNEGAHKAGCTCGFCANKGNFGKKKKDENTNAPKDNKTNKKLIVDKDKKEEEMDDEEIKEEVEKYSTAFERMRGLAGLGNTVLSSNGLWENLSGDNRELVLNKEFTMKIGDTEYDVRTDQHGSGFTCVAFLPDGKQISSSTSDTKEGAELELYNKLTSMNNNAADGSDEKSPSGQFRSHPSWDGFGEGVDEQGNLGEVTPVAAKNGWSDANIPCPHCSSNNTVTAINPIPLPSKLKNPISFRGNYCNDCHKSWGLSADQQTGKKINEDKISSLRLEFIRRALSLKAGKLSSKESLLFERINATLNKRKLNEASIDNTFNKHMGFLKKSIIENWGEERPCDCGSGESSEWEFDVQGIELCRACPRCRDTKLSKYRPETLGWGYTQADLDEPIEPDFQ